MTYGYGEPPDEPGPPARGRRRAQPDDDWSAGRPASGPPATGSYRVTGRHGVPGASGGYEPPAPRSAGYARVPAPVEPSYPEPTYPGYPDPGRPSPGRRAATGRAGVAPRQATRTESRAPAGRAPADRLPQKLWMSVLGGAVVVALLAICGVGAYFMIRDDRSGPAGAKAAVDDTATQAQKHDISSQQADPAPLTVAEVFPAATLTPDPAGPAYQVVKSELVAGCKGAAVGDLANLLAAQGCTQVVRATLLSPDKAYVITAGLFNLRDQNAANQTSTGIKASVDGQKGRFTGFDAGGATSVIVKAATQLGWDTQGHYLAYCVVARADGKPIESGDQNTTKIINDLVEVDLKGTVIAARVSPKPTGTPSSQAKASGKK